MYEIHLNFHVSENMYDRIEKIRSKMAEHSVGIKVERAKVVRLIMERGIEVIESELK